ncbi:MAG: phosphotransferase [Clostridiales bacterium]|jgi:aminoglycoside phosphotransferase (APT) family kinase protein|nr:phosphotransferase [Clostridiales bacterium]
MKFDKIIAVRNTKTVYRDGGNAVKLFDETYSKADILNEALNQALVEETGLAIPKLSDVTKIDGKWAIVMEFIDGKTLEQTMRENPSQKGAYLNLFTDLQLDVHSRRAPRLNKLKDKMNRKISASDLDDTVKYELHTRLDGMPKHDKVCHGDFNPANIIIADGDGAPYILDWSHATQGNASADAARTFLLFWLNGDRAGAESYLDLFCEKSGTAKQYVQKWIPIVAASQSVKGKEKEREFLMHWINVVDYE